ncbi:MAG TPA: hypothetical protein DD417_14405 [Elusimicrobia bacterium]|nr:hypothetical protein [Elusimicrobiota bacterium]
MHPMMLAVLLLQPQTASAQNYQAEQPGQSSTEQNLQPEAPIHEVKPTLDWATPLQLPQPGQTRESSGSSTGAKKDGLSQKEIKKQDSCSPNKKGYNSAGKKDSKCGSAEEKSSEDNASKMQSAAQSMMGQAGGKTDGAAKETPAQPQSGDPAAPRPWDDAPSAGAGAGSSQQQCYSRSGICGDTRREKETGAKLVQFKEPGLQPGDGETVAPRSSNNPSSLNGELGSIRSASPSALAEPVRTAGTSIAAAREAFTGTVVTGIFDADQTALNSAYANILRSNQPEMVRSAGLDKMKVNIQVGNIRSNLDKLRAAGVALTAAGVMTSGTLSQAVGEAGQADTAMTGAYTQLRSKITEAQTTHAAFTQYAASFNACPPPVPPAPPTPNACKKAVQAQATASKQGFLPDPPDQAAKRAFAAAEKARGTLRTAEGQKSATDDKDRAYAAAETAANSAIASFRSSFAGLAAGQSDDPNAAARLRALNAIAAKAEQSTAGMKTIHDQTFAPAWTQTVRSLESLVGKMDGR